PLSPGRSPRNPRDPPGSRDHRDETREAATRPARGLAAYSAASPTAAAATTNGQPVPAWSTSTPASAPPRDPAAIEVVTIQVYPSLIILPGVTSPTSELCTVSTGAIVAPPRMSATPSAVWFGMTASTARLAARAPSSHGNCRASGRAGGRLAKTRPPTRLPMPQTASRNPPRPRVAGEYPVANAGTATAHTPNAQPHPAAAATSAENPATRNGPSPRVRSRRPSRVKSRSTGARATTTVPTRVTSAEPNSAVAGVPAIRNSATGWITAVTSSTGAARYRSARRPATGEAAAPDSA